MPISVSRSLAQPTSLHLRNNKSRAAFAERLQSLLDPLLGLCVDGARRLIEQNNRRPLQDGASNCHSLELTARQLDTPFSNLGLVAFHLLV